MRILYAAAGTPVPGTHGGSVHAYELCRALARAGHEVHLAARAPDGRVAAPAAAPRGPRGAQTSAAGAGQDGPSSRAAGTLTLWHLPPAPIAQLEWTRFPYLRRLAERLRPDVLVERFYTFGGAGLLAARRLGIPAVLEVNSPARPYPGSWRDRLDALTLVRPVHRWRRWQLRQARAYYATSRLLLPAALQARTTVIVNGVDCAAIRPGRRPATGPLRCVYVSSFRSWHGAEHLAEAVGRAVAQGVELDVACIGDGPTLARARRIARAAGAAGAMRFLGRLPHERVAGCLAEAEVGLAPFDPDRHAALRLGWFWSPIKIFEYLAAGLAVVTAELAELRALLPAEVARFYPPGDATALAAVLAALAGDRPWIRAAGAHARALAEARYSWDEQARRVLSVLERVAVHSRA